MKSAHEWWSSNYDNFDGTAKDTIGVIQQIQLDAVKEGMRRAASVVDKYSEGCSFHDCGDCGKDDVLTAAEQLTTKDL